jgi:hypothetical protein
MCIFPLIKARDTEIGKQTHVTLRSGVKWFAFLFCVPKICSSNLVSELAVQYCYESFESFSAVLFVTEESCVTVRAKTVTVRTCFINNLCNRQGLVTWLVGDYLLFRIYYECVFYNRCNCKAVKGFWAVCDIFVCIITVVVFMLLRYFEPYGIIFLCVL